MIYKSILNDDMGRWEIITTQNFAPPKDVGETTRDTFFITERKPLNVTPYEDTEHDVNKDVKRPESFSNWKVIMNVSRACW